MLDNLRSIHNVGSIFRTADAFGIERVYLCGTTPHPHPNAPWRKDHLALIKTALGAEQTVPWEYCTTIHHALDQLHARGCKIIALEEHPRGIPLTKFITPKEPYALVVGNEMDGISSHILEHCDQIVTIPMHGQKESLNVSVAFGIASFVLTQNLQSTTRETNLSED